MSIEGADIQIIGYLGRDAEKLGKNDNHIKLSVAASKSVKNKDTGQYDKKTTWYKAISFLDSRAAYLSTLKKGDKVRITGEPQVESWKDKSGETQAIISVLINSIQVDKKKVDNEDQQPNNHYQLKANAYIAATDSDDPFALDDAIPF